MELVSWEDCQNFIREMNSLTGRRFCLPTEAEWEYAAAVLRDSALGFLCLRRVLDDEPPPYRKGARQL